MSFISLGFVYIFFPVVLICFYYINRRQPKLQTYFLLGTSFFYCGYVDLNAALILACSISVNYIIARALWLQQKQRLRAVLVTTGVLLNVIILLWFKFSLEASFGNVNKAADGQSIFLEVGIPLGISFYTFYQISFLVDIYKSQLRPLGFFQYSLSASMFSQLPAGPILNYNDGLSQFGQIGQKQIEWTSLYKGISLFTLGLIKKVFLADNLGGIVNQLHQAVNAGQELNILETVAATWGFLLQLYFDFSAYSDMAIGIGLCFGFTFPINFNSPFKATSLTDFISRWHMSLIGFTRTYIFMPVSKMVKKRAKGKAVRRQFIGWMVGLQAAFLVINIWHAPTLMLVLQGLVLGLFLVLVKIFSIWMGNLGRKLPVRFGPSSKLKAWLGRLVVLSTASVFAVLLKTRSFQEMKILFQGFSHLPQDRSSSASEGLIAKISVFLSSDMLFPSVDKSIKLFGFNALVIPVLPFLVFLSIIVFFLPNTMQVFELVRMPKSRWYSSFIWKPNMNWGLVIGLMLALYLMLASEGLTKDFMYGGF